MDNNILVYINGKPELISSYDWVGLDDRKIHRDSKEGPAVCLPDGREEYWENGLRHRLDGPAVVYPGQGGMEWYLNGKRHRIGGPAVDKEGSTYWYVYGELHRTDGPAVEQYTGTKEWYVNGLRHRTDGPATIYWDGNTAWWINGIKYSYEEWKKKVNEIRMS